MAKEKEARMIARNYSANGKIPVKGTLKRFN